MIAVGFHWSSTSTLGAGHFAQSAPEIRTSLNCAIAAIEEMYGDEYAGEDFLKRLDALSADDIKGLMALQREALLANPTLDFEDVLLIRREFGKKSRQVISDNVGTRQGNFNSIQRFIKFY